ncbi:class C sortase [Firmicutes bacterium i23-0019-B6]
MMKTNRQSEKKGKKFRNLLFWAGFLICIFPVISNMVERQRQADAVATYRQTMEKEDEKEIEEKWRQANEYNEMLFQAKGGIVEETEEKKYEELLNIHGTDIMGSLEIPKIQVELPIYHGTEDEVLSNGIGHLEGTSLPIGGENTHSVLTGHRGLPSSKLLVRLDEMKIGDLFFIHTYKEVMAYKVEEIMVVKPEDTAWMEIKDEKDLVSLVTCTPFGINSHRLIVTGRRVDYKEKEYIKIKPQFPSVREIIVTVFPILFVVSVGVIQIKNRIQTYRRQRRRKRRRKRREKNR